MDMILDGDGPLGAQLARALKRAVRSGRVSAGSRLPPTRDMAVLTGLSRGTVVAAYEALQAEGYLEGRVGIGSYVRRSRGQPARAAADPVLEPQSAFARRARATGDHLCGPPAGPPSFRYAFDPSNPQLAPALPGQWARLVARVAPYVRPERPCVQGLAALREAIAAWVGMARGIDCTADDILVVNGARQAMSLTARVLLDEGDAVAIEDPHDPGVRRVLLMEGAKLLGIPVDDEGLQVDRVPRQARLVCVTPSQQFPTGAVLSRCRRHALLEQARDQGAWVVENESEGGFRAGAGGCEPLHALDRHGRVVYIASFSRTLFPALRLGFLVMPRALRQDFIAAKWAADLASPALEQAALARFIASGAYARHVVRCLRVLATRRARLRELLADRRFAGIRLGDREGGMHLVGWLDRLDDGAMRRLVQLARERGLGLHSIAPFHLDPPASQGLVLGLGTLIASEMPAAVSILHACLREVAPMGGSRTPPRRAPDRQALHAVDAVA